MNSLTKLLQCIPPDAYYLGKQFLDQVEGIRFDSITRHRTITVLPLAMLPADKYPKKYLPPQKEFINHVLSRPVLTPQEVTPPFVQYSSLLVNFVYKNIPVFAKAVAVRMDKYDSHFLIYSAVPSLFGFFLSHDHAIMATQFYKRTMNIIPPELSSELMKPFFTSVVTYRFIEAVMHPFIYRFASDPKVVQLANIKSGINYSSNKKSKDKNSSYESVMFSYGKMLFDLIIQSTPLLPAEILELLDFMYQLHWSQEEFNDFFFDNFFNTVSSLYLCSTPCLKSEPVFKEVLNYLKESSMLNPEFFHKAFFEGSTRFEIPPIYSMLDLPYLDFALTIADVAAVTNAIADIIELPPSLKGISYSKFSKSKFFKMYAVRTFIRKNKVSELCLTMNPTQEANNVPNKKKKGKKSESPNKPLSNSFDSVSEYKNNFYNLKINPNMRPRIVDYDNEKLEGVVFNIERFQVEDNPEFERIFLKEHYSSENEEKSANDITIDLIDRIGPDSCNFLLFSSPTAEKDASTEGIKKNDSKLSSEDLSISGLTKEADCDEKTDFESDEKLSGANMNKSLIDISGILNNEDNNDNADLFNSNPPADINLSPRSSKSKTKSKFSTDEDDFKSYDGISSSLKAISQSSGDLSVIPIDGLLIDDISNQNDNSAKTPEKSNLYESEEMRLDIYLLKRRANLLIDQSNVFENYLRFLLAAEQYSSFTSLLSGLESIICAPLAMNLATFARRSTIADAWLRIVKVFNTDQLKRLIFFIVSSGEPKKCLSSLSFTKLINNCNKFTLILIEKLLKNFDLSCETNKLNFGESEFFWRAVECLQVMNEDIPVAMQIEAMNYVFTTLKKVEDSIIGHSNPIKSNSNDHNSSILQMFNDNDNSNDLLNFESLIFLAFLASKCSIMPARFILFYHFVVIKNPYFEKILGNDTVSCWKKFEQFITHLINFKDAEKLRKAISKLKSQLN